jgi:predicted esterase
MQKMIGAGSAALFCALLGAAPAAVQAQSVQAPRESSSATGTTMWVTTTQRLKTRVYQGAHLSEHPVLIVVVHGDSPNGPPTYHYRFAETVAADLPDVVAAAILRPGYSDGDDRSDGMRGETTGDNYTPEVVDAVATALTELKARYSPRKVVLVGHSGGAAILANLLGRSGSVADAALLVSCPCDLAAWRKHMQQVKGGSIWERPVRSLSPIAMIDGIAPSTGVWMLVGSDDQVTPPALTLAYAEALRSRGGTVNVTVAPDLSHNILLEPVTIDRLKEVVGINGASR